MTPVDRQGNETEPEDIRAVYLRRLEDRTATHRRSALRDRIVADLRLAVFVAGVVAAFFVARGTGTSAWWLAIPAGVYLALVLVHEPMRRASDRARRAVEFYSKGLARLDGKWAGTGLTGQEFLEVDHPYAADLDLFGTGSLFERLCTARTRAGERALARWLLAPADRAEIKSRHAAIGELRPRLDLREDIELLGVEISAAIDPGALASWGAAKRAFESPLTALTATVLGLAGTAALIGWAYYNVGLLPLLVVIIVDSLFMRALARRVRTVLTAIDKRTGDLVLLAELLRRLERERFQAPLLARLSTDLQTDGLPASKQIGHLARLLRVLDWQRNQLFMPVAALWLWTIQLAVRIDAWRADSGPKIAAWLDAIGRFEALCALAAYSAENPADPFPELADGPARFHAEAIGHPLLPLKACVRNDVSLGDPVRVLIVSGSNMSGKSTLLRTLGTNTVLALAGAPVRASRVLLSPLAVGATLRIQDSLQAGRSRFYAEITRVRQLVDISRGPLPLLFLFDELFHGTNSHDRCVGAQSIIHGLIGHGAIGLVTTHDLALTQIADSLGSQVKNMHFEDRLVDGQMQFDYRMRPGVVQHSNALALMRAVGLDVPEEPSSSWQR